MCVDRSSILLVNLVWSSRPDRSGGHEQGHEQGPGAGFRMLWVLRVCTK